MTTLRQVVKEVLKHEGVSANPTTFAESLTKALAHYGYGIHDKQRCVRPWKQELGREMTDLERRTLLGESAAGAETPSDQTTSQAPSSP